MTSEMPGWDAIDQALDRLYPDVKPEHYGTLLAWRFGGPDPLDGMSFYPREDPVPHWHVVTYGMSELFEKESENAEDSGWGFEFTFRIRRDPDEAEPPQWARTFLQNLGRYVIETGNWFAAGHHMDIKAPIAVDRETQMRAIAITHDPELGTIDTPNGKVQFLQVFGITSDEFAVTEAWSVKGLLGLAAQHLPLLVTDLDRPSPTADRAISAAIEAGRLRDGSAMRTLVVDDFRWDRDDATVRLVVGAHIAERVAQTLRGRLPYGRFMDLRGPYGGVRFLPGEAFACSEEEPQPGWLDITLPEPALDGLTGVLTPHVGTRPVPGAPGVVVEIEVSETGDGEGNGPTIG
jgi:suppressor of fused